MCKGISGRENVLCLVFSLVQSPADYESGESGGRRQGDWEALWEKY